MSRTVSRGITVFRNQEAASLAAAVFVIPGTAVETDVKVPTTADATAMGVTLYKGSATAGEPVEIQLTGAVELMVKAAGTNIAVGDPIGVHGTTGYGKKSALSNTNVVLAMALEAATADDVMISVLLTRSWMPSA